MLIVFTAVSRHATSRVYQLIMLLKNKFDLILIWFETQSKARNWLELSQKKCAGTVQEVFVICNFFKRHPTSCQNYREQTLDVMQGYEIW